jgi:hypothetical protein
LVALSALPGLGSVHEFAFLFCGPVRGDWRTVYRRAKGASHRRLAGVHQASDACMVTHTAWRSFARIIFACKAGYTGFSTDCPRVGSGQAMVTIARGP